MYNLTNVVGLVLQFAGASVLFMVDWRHSHLDGTTMKLSIGDQKRNTLKIKMKIGFGLIAIGSLAQIVTAVMNSQI